MKVDRTTENVDLRNGSPYIQHLAGGISLVAHPAVRRFATFVTTEYSPPPGKRIALFLPCTAKKPYSSSRTYHAIYRILEKFPRDAADAIHVLTISEPLGVVPAELELTYPAAHYDVVLGSWFPIRHSRSAKSTRRKEQPSLEARRCLDVVTDRVFQYLDRLSGQYVFLVGYLRGTQRRMLVTAAGRAEVQVIYPLANLRATPISKRRGSINWALNGLRMPESLNALEGCLGKCLKAIGCV